LVENIIWSVENVRIPSYGGGEKRLKLFIKLSYDIKTFPYLLLS